MFNSRKLKQEIAELQQRVLDRESTFANERAALQQERKDLQKTLDQANSRVAFHAGLFDNLLLFAQTAGGSQQSLAQLANAMKTEAGQADNALAQASKNVPTVDAVCENVRTMASNIGKVAQIVGLLNDEAA